MRSNGNKSNVTQHRGREKSRPQLYQGGTSMARKYEVEDGRPEDWRSEVVYVRNPDGSITELEEGEADDADDTQG